MNKLNSHVDYLFRKYSKTTKIMELKLEVLSNLEAKVEDLTANGVNYDDALEMAKASLMNIDNLIDENTEIYINKYLLEFYQIILVYSLIAWILTTPLRIIGTGFFLNFILFFSCIIIGIRYILALQKKKSDDFQLTAFVNIQSAKRTRKIAWILWLTFALISTISVTAIQFGSNLWFSRAVNIDGPYQFALIVLKYVLPLFSILIPLALNSVPVLLSKYQAGENHEN